MALISFTAKLIGPVPSAGARSGISHPGTALDHAAAKAAATALTYAAFATALGVLVTDGATPTQAHVNTANTAWTALKAQIDTLVATAPASVTVATGGILVNIDTTAVPTISKLNALFLNVEAAARAQGTLTP